MTRLAKVHTSVRFLDPGSRITLRLVADNEPVLDVPAKLSARSGVLYGTGT